MQTALRVEQEHVTAPLLLWRILLCPPFWTAGCVLRECNGNHCLRQQQDATKPAPKGDSAEPLPRHFLTPAWQARVLLQKLCWIWAGVASTWSDKGLPWLLLRCFTVYDMHTYLQQVRGHSSWWQMDTKSAVLSSSDLESQQVLLFSAQIASWWWSSCLINIKETLPFHFQQC